MKASKDVWKTCKWFAGRIPGALLALLTTVCLSFSGCSPLSGLVDRELEEVIAPSGGSGAGSSQSSSASQAPAAAVTELKIPYNSLDGLHPYSARTVINRYICPLLYSPLVQLSPSFSPEMVLAESVSGQGQTWTVRLKEGLAFNDGSPVTASDVLYSIDQARGEGSVYAVSLAGIDSVQLVDDRTLTVTLLSPDNLFSNLLTFPILRKGTADAPVSAGRFVLQEDRLLAASGNPLYTPDSLTSIRLVELHDSKLLNYSLKTGEIDYTCLESSSGQDITLVGNSVSYAESTCLVFIGLDSGSGPVADPLFRQALDLLTDRQAMANVSYGAAADPVMLPYPSGFLPEDITPSVPDYADLEAAGQLLDSLGYDQRDEEGYRLSSGSRLTLRILVNSENPQRLEMAQVLSDTLALAGIASQIEAKDFALYQQDLAGVDFDLYFGEVKLQGNLDLTPFFSEESLLHSGIIGTELLPDAYLQLRAGQLDWTGFVQQFRQALPFLPVLFRKETVSFSRNNMLPVTPTGQDIFYGLHPVKQ